MKRSTRLKKGPRKLPKFRSKEEEARFFETHDMAPYWDELKDADNLIELAPDLARRIRERMKKRLMAIRLEEWQITRAKEIARKKGVPYQTLMRQWIAQGIRQESSSKRQAK